MVQHIPGKTKEGLGFIKTSPKTTLNNLIENYFLSVGNVTMKESIGTSIFFPYSYEEKYISSLLSQNHKIKERHFHLKKRFNVGRSLRYK